MSSTIQRIDRVIRRKNQQIQRLRELRSKLCASCQHTNIVGEFHADTGNWCRHAFSDRAAVYCHSGHRSPIYVQAWEDALDWDKHKLRELDRRKITLLLSIMSNNGYRMSDCFWSRTADLFTHK